LHKKQIINDILKTNFININNANMQFYFLKRD
jgi:hypothetical protein